MAPLLGKRKRRDKVVDSRNEQGAGTQDENAGSLHSLLRQHFETRFEPLKGVESSLIKKEAGEESAPDADSESDWSGCEEEEEEEKARAVEIIHDSTMPSSKAEVPREESTAFMTAKPPSTKGKQSSTVPKKHPKSIDEEKGTDAENLKKDLALQRLLKESHLLDSRSSLSHTGNNRHKALDLRLQDMGSKSSIFAQQKMPLAQRKGIIAKSAERDELRRRQAQENGIILEKAIKGKSKASSNRQRGIGAPSIGRFQGGMLKLSKKDVADIEGPKRTTKKRR